MQKAAYELLSSDVSSDVCSSDLPRPAPGADRAAGRNQVGHPRSRLLNPMPEPRGRTSRFSEPLPDCRLVPRTKNSLAARHHMSDRLAPNPLDRAELISLLETLGSDNDEEVLAAAREIGRAHV